MSCFIKKQDCLKKTGFGCLSFFALPLLFSACGPDQDIKLASTKGEDKSAEFFQSRQEQDSDRADILKQSHKIYTGDKLCSTDPSCLQKCGDIFSVESDQKDCGQLPSVQVDRFEELFGFLQEESLDSLEKIDAFDFKVFINLSPEPFSRFLKTSGLFSSKIFLSWIACDWQIAEVFYKEDHDFLFLEIFLNKIQISPIDSLREKLMEGRSFAELAWIKQNDFALFWLDGYLKGQCVHIEGEDKADNCLLSQYCSLSQGFKKDVLEEIMDFEPLKPLVDKKRNLPRKDLQELCLAFCPSEENEGLCY